MGGQGMSPCTSATLGVSNPVPPAANSCKECWGSVGNLAEPTHLTWPYRASCVGNTRLSPSRAVPWLWADQHWLVKGRQTQTHPIIRCFSRTWFPPTGLATLSSNLPHWVASSWVSIGRLAAWVSREPSISSRRTRPLDFAYCFISTTSLRL